MIDLAITGLDALRAKFTRLPAIAQKHVGTATQASAAAIVAGAKANVPVRSGRLKAAIAARVVRNSVAGVSVSIEISDPVAAKYAHLVEFGTRYVGARPFLHHAENAERGRHEQRLSAAVSAIEAEMER